MIDVAINELPKLWKECDLEEVVRVIRGISFKSSEKLFEPGKNTIVCLRTANVQEEVDWNNLWWVPEKFVKRDEQFIQKNDILMSNANSYELVGKVSLVRSIPEKATLGAFITMLRAEKDVDPRFIFYQLRSSRVVKEIRSRASTTTNISNVSTGKLRDIPLWIAPPEQQKRIVAKIEKLFSHIDAGIASLQAAKKLLKQYRQSVLKAAVTGELTKDWRKANKDKLEPASQLLERILIERRQRWEEQQLEQFKAKGKLPKDDKWKEKYKEPTEPVFEELGEIPDKWAWGGIEQISSHIVDCLHSTAKFTESGKYCIDTNCMESGHIPFGKARFVSDEIFEDRVRRLKPIEGDILFSREGTIGLAALVPPGVELCLGQRMMMFRAECGVLPKYFMWASLSPIFVFQWKPRVLGTTAPHVNIGDIRTMALPIPPVEEQLEIANLIEQKLSALSRLENDIELQHSKAEINKQSVLVSAFLGKLIN